MSVAPVPVPRSRRQQVVNIWLFFTFAGGMLWQGTAAWQAGSFDIVTGSFIVQSCVLAALFLLRHDHRALDPSPWHQAVALAAVLSAVLLPGTMPTGDAQTAAVARAVTLTANLLGIITLLNLGRSFGILVALREVRTQGLYRIVRHPMYLTDIMLRLGYVVGHCTPWTVTVVVLSSACYVWRALLEERFLDRDPAYRAYRQQVRYRFIPLVW